MNNKKNRCGEKVKEGNGALEIALAPHRRQWQ